MKKLRLIKEITWTGISGPIIWDMTFVKDMNTINVNGTYPTISLPKFSVNIDLVRWDPTDIKDVEHFCTELSMRLDQMMDITVFGRLADELPKVRKMIGELRELGFIDKIPKLSGDEDVLDVLEIAGVILLRLELFTLWQKGYFNK